MQLITVALLSVLTAQAPAAPETKAVSRTWAGAQLEFDVPSDWNAIPGWAKDVPHYGPRIYRYSTLEKLDPRDLAALNGAVLVQRDNEDNRRWLMLWGEREFSIYLQRSATPAEPYTKLSEYSLEWELLDGRDTHYQLVKNPYGFKGPRYWWRGARRVQVGDQRFVMIVWKELDRHPGKAGDAPHNAELKSLYKALESFQAK